MENHVMEQVTRVMIAITAVGVLVACGRPNPSHRFSVSVPAPRGPSR